MDELDKWRLCDELNIKQAALLIAGEDPSASQYYVEDNWEPHRRPDGYEAGKAALSSAVRSLRLPAKVKEATEYVQINDKNSWEEYGLSEIDINKTFILVSDIRDWLSSRGCRTGFFFDEGGIISSYLNTYNQQYAPKLAAAVRAWEAVTSDPELLKGKSPKEALMKWLRENAAQFDLTKDDGTLNEQGIKEVAKVANWNTTGGAPKTPETRVKTENVVSTGKPPKQVNNCNFGKSFPDDDDDIPF